MAKRRLIDRRNLAAAAEGLMASTSLSYSVWTPENGDGDLHLTVSLRRVGHSHSVTTGHRRVAMPLDWPVGDHDQRRREHLVSELARATAKDMVHRLVALSSLARLTGRPPR